MLKLGKDATEVSDFSNRASDTSTENIELINDVPVVSTKMKKWNEIQKEDEERESKRILRREKELSGTT